MLEILYKPWYSYQSLKLGGAYHFMKVNAVTTATRRPSISVNWLCHMLYDDEVGCYGAKMTHPDWTGLDRVR